GRLRTYCGRPRTTSQVEPSHSLSPALHAPESGLYYCRGRSTTFPVRSGSGSFGAYLECQSGHCAPCPTHLAKGMGRHKRNGCAIPPTRGSAAVRCGTAVPTALELSARGGL